MKDYTKPSDTSHIFSGIVMGILLSEGARKLYSMYSNKSADETLFSIVFFAAFGIIAYFLNRKKR